MDTGLRLHIRNVGRRGEMPQVQVQMQVQVQVQEQERTPISAP